MTKIDFSTLKSQEPKEYSEISYTSVMSLFNYLPWGDGTNIDQITNSLLNLKTKDTGKFWLRTKAVTFFTNAIKGQLSGLKCDSDKVCCIVPSHQKDGLSEGMMQVMGGIITDFDFKNTGNLLKRKTTVAKSATGGDRSLQHHIDSIEVTDAAFVKGKVVYLFDDISSTGNSLAACKSLLLTAGATQVVMISLGQTVADI
ncbi:MAG: putative amidophosphoribosyltransferase [Oleispira sp.]